MKKILLYPCGINVKLKNSNIEGMITCQMIRFNKVTYEITYFISGEQKVIWCHKKEFICNSSRAEVGFKLKG